VYGLAMFGIPTLQEIIVYFTTRNHDFLLVWPCAFSIDHHQHWVPTIQEIMVYLTKTLYQKSFGLTFGQFEHVQFN
jgi:hypothetical protein